MTPAVSCCWITGVESTFQRLTRYHGGFMTATTADRPFSFETSYQTGEGGPERRDFDRPRLRRAEDPMFVSFAVIGGLCLFWRYTLALGIATLLITFFLWTMRERSRDRQKRYKPLEEPTTTVRVGASEAGYWIRG